MNNIQKFKRTVHPASMNANNKADKSGGIEETAEDELREIAGVGEGSVGEDETSEECIDENEINGNVDDGVPVPSREQLIATGELDPDPDEPAGDNEEIPESMVGQANDGSKFPMVVENPEDEHTSDKKSTRSQTKDIEEKLLMGVSREELVAAGYNKNSVRTIYSQLKTAGRLPNGRRGGRGGGDEDGGTRAVATRGSRGVAATEGGLPVFAKGSPIEALIDHYAKLPNLEDGRGDIFENGMKFGLSVAVLGIRMAQELSGIGVQQAKPLLDMAKSMREGEAMAAKNSASEAATEAAGMVYQQIAPVLSMLSKQSHETNVPAGDPMKAMMVRTMEPIMQGLMSKVLPGLALPPGGQKQITEGWTHEVQE